jgi:hypothetical protein
MWKFESLEEVDLVNNWEMPSRGPVGVEQNHICFSNPIACVTEEVITPKAAKY